MTAVNAPPTASALKSTPATPNASRIATAIVASRSMKPNVPAVAGSIRRRNVGTDEAAHRPRQPPAEPL